MTKTRYSDYPDHPLRYVPQRVLDAATRALDEADYGHGARGGLITIEADDVEPVAHAVLLAALVEMRGATPPPGWHVFGSHANYREDFGEECPPLIFSDEVDEAGMPLYERIDPAAIRRGTAQQIAEETLPLLQGHVGCISRAQDSLRRYLSTPLPELDMDEWNGPTCYGCGARLSTANDPGRFLPMSEPDAEGYQCRSSYAATGETPSQAWCKKLRKYV